MIFASTDQDFTGIIRYFGGLATQIPLSYGDYVFWGAGPNSTAISICIERKRTQDLIQSLVRTKRLIQQIRNAREAHEVIYLITEGAYRPGEDGLVEVPRGRGEWVPVDPTVSYRTLDNHLNSVANTEGIVIKRTITPKETAQCILNLYFWHQTPPEQHTTGHTKFTPMPLVGKLPLIRRVAMELSHCGWEISGRLEQRFKTVVEMVNADEQEWLAVDGLGKKSVADILRELGR